MKRIKNLYLYFREILKQKLRTIKAICQYPQIDIEVGVIIGPHCVFGQDVKLYKNVVIADSSVGDYSYIGKNNEIKNCSIGKYCAIAPDVKIGLGIHPVDKISTYPGFYSKKASGSIHIDHDPTVLESKPVVIGNDVWIGTNSLILDGVTIGNGAIIAAGSVVTKDVKPYAIVAGVPAKTIRMRFEDMQITLLENFKWWDKDLDWIRDHSKYFLNSDLFFTMILNSENNLDNNLKGKKND